MSSNLKKACHALGWAGGTIHQVAKATKLTVDQILKAKDIEGLILLIEAHRALTKDLKKNKSLIDRMSNQINGQAWLALNS